MITPLIKISNNMVIKFVCFNVSGSHKVRAANFIIENVINQKKVVPETTTVIEKTSGNFGFGLISACNKFYFNMEIAVGHV